MVERGEVMLVSGFEDVVIRIRGGVGSRWCGLLRGRSRVGRVGSRWCVLLRGRGRVGKGRVGVGHCLSVGCLLLSYHENASDKLVWLLNQNQCCLILFIE